MRAHTAYLDWEQAFRNEIKAETLWKARLQSFVTNATAEKTASIL